MTEKQSTDSIFQHPIMEPELDYTRFLIEQRISKDTHLLDENKIPASFLLYISVMQTLNFKGTPLG